MKRILILVAPGVFVLLWSTGFIGSKLGSPYADPMVFLSIRFAAVLPLIAGIAVLRCEELDQHGLAVRGGGQLQVSPGRGAPRGRSLPGQPLWRLMREVRADRPTP